MTWSIIFIYRISIYHALRQNERKFLTFYFPKLLILFPIWLCAVVLAIWEKLDELRDPTWIHFYGKFFQGYWIFPWTRSVQSLWTIDRLILKIWYEFYEMHFFDFHKFWRLKRALFKAINCKETNLCNTFSVNAKTSSYLCLFTSWFLIKINFFSVNKIDTKFSVQQKIKKRLIYLHIHPY